MFIYILIYIYKIFKVGNMNRLKIIVNNLILFLGLLVS